MWAHLFTARWPQDGEELAVAAAPAGWRPEWLRGGAGRSWRAAAVSVELDSVLCHMVGLNDLYYLDEFLTTDSNLTVSPLKGRRCPTN